MNYFRIGILLAALTALFVAIGFMIGGTGGMLIAFGIALAMNMFAYWNADKMVLRMYGAREVDAHSAPDFHRLVAPLELVGAILIVVLAPLAAALVRMAISRNREYAAGRGGAEICGNPRWLASALEKLVNSAHSIDNQEAEANPATAHLFIVNPLHARAADSLFSTHPPNTAERVRRLRATAADGRPEGNVDPWAGTRTEPVGPWG